MFAVFGAGMTVRCLPEELQHIAIELALLIVQSLYSRAFQEMLDP